MANPAMIREALMKLMGAKTANKSIKPSERQFRTQYETTGDYGEPSVGNMINKVPTAKQSEQLAIDGPGQGEAWGTFPADSTSAAVRNARGESRYRQGTDPLTQPMQPKEFMPDENQFEPPIPRTQQLDPQRLPGATEPSNEAITIFEQVMQGDANPALLSRLEQLDPKLANIAKRNLQDDGVIPSTSVDDIPF